MTPPPGLAPLQRSGGVGLAPRGRLADNVVHFVRVLRAAGLPVGPARALAALEAVEAVGLANREDFRAALAAVLVSRHEQLPVFEQAFDLFWRNPKLLEKLIASLLPTVFGRGGETSEPELPARIAQAMLPPVADLPRADDDEVVLDAAFTMSPREVLQRKDFETMTTEELAAVRVLLCNLRLPLPELPTRRTTPDSRGHRVDLRATLRRATGAAGRLAPLAWRRRVRRTPPLVVLCDISGSMDRYARMLLHFLHAITNDRDRVHVLLFGTRLTNITRHLKHRDVDVALARVTMAVADWAGGTRIGSCLAEFNRRWSRRLLGQNAVVLLISDGLDAEGGEGLAAQAERLAKSCRRLVWLNPLLRYEGFEARPAGIKAMLPFVDDFLPVHNLDSLTGLAAALDRAPGRSRRVGRASGASGGRRWR
ncbi:MAG TPA: VWA domain-containing protein [Casimicrobiaceae bacterium]|nr:VWA domain-containing protein [Casimicrobiaceae bacterium]